MIHTILLVEDEQSLRAAVAKTLTDRGYNVVTAITGTDAIKQYKKVKPDLILLDIILPEKSGFSVLEELRVKLQSTTPIIILSNLDQPDDITTGKHLGANDYVLKSNTSLKDIVQLVHQTLAHSHT